MIGAHLPAGVLAQSVARIQDRIASSQTEMVTGRLADPVASLGAGHGRALSWEAEAGRLDRIAETNALVSARLDATAHNLQRLGQTGASLLDTLVGAVGGALDRTFLQASVSGLREAVGQSLNATHDGGYLFAGITSDVRPLRDVADAALSLEARFQAAFGHASDDPATGAITPDAAAAFAADAVDWLSGTGWSLVSDASDISVSARIGPGESVETSVSANIDPARKLFATAFVGERLFGGEFSGSAVAAIAEALLTPTAGAGAGFARQEGLTGFVQARIDRADERLAQDADQLRALATETLGVDPFEAAQRFNQNVVQLETAYALTARLSDLSLMRFL